MKTSTNSCFKGRKTWASSFSATLWTLGRPLLPGPVFGTLGPFPLLVKETAPAKKQKTASGRVTALTPKPTTKKPKACGTPTKLQPTRSQVYPKTRSPKPSPKQRRFQASIRLAYLAPLKENRFYPLAYTKEDRPAFRQTMKSTQHEPACSYNPKIKLCITRPLEEPAKACTPSVHPLISTFPPLHASSMDFKMKI